MRVMLIVDEGLAREIQTGCGQDTVQSLQSAIKYLIKNKDVDAVTASEIEVYPLGVTKETFEEMEPLQPDDKLPKGSTKKNAIFVHVPREKQDLSAEKRRLSAMQPELPGTDPVEVTVRCADGKEFQAIVDPKDRIIDLKKQFAEESGVPAKSQSLYLDGEEMLNQKTARAHGIQDGDMIDLIPKTMQVIVRPPDGGDIPVRLKPAQKIKFIKEEVAFETGIEVPEQILTYNGEELPNNKSAREMGLRDGSVLDLRANAIEVMVRTPDENTIPVTLYPSDNMLFIKEEVEQESGVEVPPEQILTRDGEELPNDKTAKELGLQDGDILDLEPMAIQVFVRHENDKIPVTLFPSDNVLFIKEEVEEVLGMEVEQQVLTYEGEELPNDKTADEIGLKDGSILDLERSMIQVFVRTPEDGKISVFMSPTDKIESIKEKVEEETGIEVEQQILTYEGEELPDEKTADEVGLKNGSVLDLERAMIQVFVRTPDDEQIPVTMSPNDTVLFIKGEVAPESGIEVPQQILKYNGRVLPDEKSAEEVGLQDGSVLDLVPKKISVNVRTAEGKNLTPVQMLPWDLVEFIKETVAPEAGVAPPNQVLTYEGKVLLDHESAEDVGLVDGCTLQLEPDTILLNVVTPDGETLFVRVRPSDTIENVKEMVAPDAGIEVPNQILTYNGNELPNDETVDDAGLKDGSTLYVHPDTIQVHVETPDGKTIPVRLKPSDAIQRIKERVEPETGIEIPKQILKYNGKELPDEKTADDMGLKDGSIIDLMVAYTPTPFDMSKNRVFYQLGETVPYYIRINGWEGVGVLKQRILETRSKRKNCPYLHGVTDPSVLQVYASGPDGETGPELGADEDIPSNSSFENPLIVVKAGEPVPTMARIEEEEEKVVVPAPAPAPAAQEPEPEPAPEPAPIKARDEEEKKEDKKMERRSSVQDQVKARIAARRRASAMR